MYTNQGYQCTNLSIACTIATKYRDFKVIKGYKFAGIPIGCYNETTIKEFLIKSVFTVTTSRCVDFAGYEDTVK